MVSYDLGEDQAWDVIPRAGRDHQAHTARWRQHSRRITSGYWYCHRRLGSRARLCHGTDYDLPEALGRFDAAVLGCVLLHLRDPLRALEAVAARVERTIVVTELLPWRRLHRRFVERWLPPTMELIPGPEGQGPEATWWWISAGLVQRHLATLGFPRTSLSHHFQRHRGRWVPMYTVVGRR